MPAQITKIVSFLSKARNWKSPGSSQIQNIDLKLFQLTKDLLQKNFNIPMEK